MARARRSESLADEMVSWAKRYETDEGIRTFESGLSLKVLFGAFFVGFLMMPGAIYLSLQTGQSAGGAAAPWVAVILFTELARRSFQTVKRQELYILLALTGAAVNAGGQYSGYIFDSYFINSQQAESYEIADKIPDWAIPPKESKAHAVRSLFHRDWWLAARDKRTVFGIAVGPITLMLILQLLGRIRHIGGSYFLFRLTADFEKLPFPLAPVHAQGATALAESTHKKETWRWRVFSIGSIIGMAWGVVYVGIPQISGALGMTEPIRIIPIPFIDFTQSIESFAPSGVFAIHTDASAILRGFVMPIPVVVAQFLTACFTQFFLNPFLYHRDIIHTWEPGMDVRVTQLRTNLDFWMSFSIGRNFAFAILGLFTIASMYMQYGRQRRAAGRQQVRSWAPPPGRGDFPVWLAFLLWVIGMSGYVYVVHRLIPLFPLKFLLFFAFLYTPLNSYISARTFGIMSRDLFEIPYIKEAVVILSRYEQIDIWFAPFPNEDYGGETQGWRVLELTGTTFTSKLAADFIAWPILLIAGIVAWHFIWKLAPIPSAQYQFAQMMWPFFATQRALWVTALRDGQSEQLQAIRGNYVLIGGLVSLLLYGITVLSHVPYRHIAGYGVLGGLGADPGAFFLEFIGAMTGRYVMIKRFGRNRWARYNPVLLAGFWCGLALVGMAGVAIDLLQKAVIVKPF
ncbi:MAG: hypothetical protein KatS3mg115_1482 [Candidatus Poribacteria bacterium]|nr:MAG: hypothetical protein KatS3mg115_1482 [Candidatus Poribacteria bacterium]